MIDLPAMTLLVSLGLAGLLLVAVERGRSTPRELALIAALGALAGAGRTAFAPIPSVQPVTVICLVAGACLGARVGAGVGVVSVLVSNAFLGHGPWTLPQMGLWAAVGASGALLRPLVRNPAGLAAVAVAWAFAFGWAMNAWFLAAFGPELSVEAFLLVSARSLPFEITGAIGSAVIALGLGPPLGRMLARYGARVRVSYGPVSEPRSRLPSPSR